MDEAGCVVGLSFLGPKKEIRTIGPANTGKGKEVPVKRELDNLITQMHAGGITYDEAVREFKRRFILEVLSSHRGNQCKAAKELGVHRNTLSRILTDLKIDPGQVRTAQRRPPQRDRSLFDAGRRGERA